MLINRSVSIENTEGRTLLGRAFKFDTPVQVTDDGRTFYKEAFSRSCANKSLSDKGRYPLLFMHNADVMPLGNVTFNASHDGLYFEAALSRTSNANDALELVRDGVVTQVSIGARAIKQAIQQDVIVREEIALRELSLCSDGFAALPDAEILALRSIKEIKRLTLNDVNYQLLILTTSL